MKRLIVVTMIAVLALGVWPAAEVSARPGGVGGLLVGCCFGIRTTGQWNEGKDLHWREWGRLIPYVNIVFMVWDGIDGAQGVTTSSLADQYGANFY